jgi:hypothetical protein
MNAQSSQARGATLGINTSFRGSLREPPEEGIDEFEGSVGLKKPKAWTAWIQHTHDHVDKHWFNTGDTELGKCGSHIGGYFGLLMTSIHWYSGTKNLRKLVSDQRKKELRKNLKEKMLKLTMVGV